MRPAIIVLFTIALGCVSSAASAQGIGARGFVTFGTITFTADQSFDAVLERSSGPIFGGGGQALLPWGIYVEVSASQFKQDGERVFVGPDDEVFPLGIPLTVTIQPLEITGGWRYLGFGQIVPYGGGGYSSYRYQETSDFADEGEDVDERFSGFHILGGVEYQPVRWLAVGGEVAWSSIANALGESGVSAAFGEDNLGGTTLRLKVSIGR